MIHFFRRLSSYISKPFVFLFLFPFLLTVAIEKLHHGTWQDTWTWFSDSFTLFMFNYAIALSFCVLVSMLIGSISIGFFVSTMIMLLLTTASGLKHRSIGQPLLPWDLTLNMEGLNISRYVVGGSHFRLILGILILVIGTLAWVRRIPRQRFSLLSRMAIASLSLAVLYALAFPPKQLDLLKDKLNIAEVFWDQNENYKQNGFFMAFVTNMRHAFVAVPPHYSEKTIKEIRQNIEKNKKLPTAQVSVVGKRPNIVVVMSEAFWDPTRIAGISFNTDPLRFFHSLQKKYTSGWLYTPQYGGGTANVEFEVLTGHSTDFLPQGSIPYEHFIRRPISSVPWMLTKQGYKSIAIHSYNGWFWSRNKVYPFLGFQQFISSEGFANPTLKGHFIADEEVSKAIIRSTEQNPSPQFIFAVTMQNHGPYDDQRYKETQIKVTAKLSKASRHLMETYAQGVADADKFLETLVHYYQKAKEPTILVFFGDHLPMLGEHYSVYTETGYISTNQTTHWKASDFQLMRTVPVVIWSNYDLPKQKIESLPTSLLAPYLLDLAGLLQTDYFHFLHQFSDRRKEAKTTEDDHAKYWLLEYDQLFGKDYLHTMLE